MSDSVASSSGVAGSSGLGGSSGASGSTSTGGASGSSKTTVAPKPGICDKLTWDTYPTSNAVCTAGQTKRAYCSDGWFSTRTCDSSGTYWSRSSCDYRGSEGLNQEADFIFLTRRDIANKPGYESLVGAVSGIGHHTVATVYVEDLVRAFPSTSVADSIRLGLRHFLLEERLPNLKFAMSVGRIVSWKKNTNTTGLSYDWEVPLPYVQGPVHTVYGDSANETMIPSAAPWQSLRSEKWPDWSNPYATPEAFNADIHFGYLPAIGENVSCDADGSNCQTDLQVYADKMNDWKVSPLVSSQFHGFACNGDTWDDWTVQNGQSNSVTQTIINHDCSGGEAGKAWEIATKDGSKYSFFDWHGGPDGSSIYDETTKTGYDMIGVNMLYSGVVFAHSCSVGSPDQWDWSLGGTLMAKVGGPPVIIAYDRVLIGNLEEPMQLAFATGDDYSIGAIVDRYKHRRMSNLHNVYEAKAMLSLLLYGNPALLMAPEPKKTVRVLATRPTDSGETEACVQVHAPDGTETELLIDGRKVQDVKFSGTEWLNLPVTFSAAEVKRQAFAHLTACDPKVESCRVGMATALRDLPLACGPLAYQADGSYDLEVTAPVGQNGPDGSLKAVVSVVTMKCEGGVRTDCFVNVEPYARSEKVIAEMTVKRLLPGNNGLNIFLNVTFDKGESFRGLRVKLTGASGSSIGECFVPGSQADFIDYGLI